MGSVLTDTDDAKPPLVSDLHFVRQRDTMESIQRNPWFGTRKAMFLDAVSSPRSRADGFCEDIINRSQ
jgi:hypothetical protein